MGRPKTYEREDVARKAMELFWARGFNETSTKDLAAHMGINVYSLFAEFESKQGLYEAALDVYRREVVASNFSALDGPEAGLDEIVGLLDLFADIADQPLARRGCFMCNTATERAPSDRGSQRCVAAHFAHTEKAFHNALSNAKARGELRADVSCTDHGKLLTATVVGLAVLLRAGVEAAVIVGAVSAARQQIELMRA
jgi:TetR/AcrR family transcriptional repressor of nem operon